MNRQDEMITLANSSRPGDTSWVNGGTTAASAGGKFARRAPLDVKTCIHSGGVDKLKLWEELGENCLIYISWSLEQCVRSRLMCVFSGQNDTT